MNVIVMINVLSWGLYIVYCEREPKYNQPLLHASFSWNFICWGLEFEQSKRRWPQHNWSFEPDLWNRTTAQLVQLNGARYCARGFSSITIELAIERINLEVHNIHLIDRHHTLEQLEVELFCDIAIHWSLWSWTIGTIGHFWTVLTGVDVWTCTAFNLRACWCTNWYSIFSVR